MHAPTYLPAFTIGKYVLNDGGTVFISYSLRTLRVTEMLVVSSILKTTHPIHQISVSSGWVVRPIYPLILVNAFR